MSVNDACTKTPASEMEPWYSYHSYLNANIPLSNAERLYKVSEVFYYPVPISTYQVFLRKIGFMVNTYLTHTMYTNSIGVVYTLYFRELFFRIHFNLTVGSVNLIRNEINRPFNAFSELPGGFQYYYNTGTKAVVFNVNENQMVPFEKLPLLINHKLPGIHAYAISRLEGNIEDTCTNFTVPQQKPTNIPLE